MAKRRRSIHEDQARAQAKLRSDPERRGLTALVLELQGQRDADIAASQAGARGIRSAVREADPRVAKVYRDARQGVSAVTGDYSRPAMGGIARDYSQLGPAAASIGEAARAESEGAQRRMMESEARARVDLQQQGVRAGEGAVFAARSAEDRYRAGVGKVAQQLAGLDQDEGLYTATTLGQLIEAQKGRDLTARGQDITARGQDLTHADSVASREAAARKKKAKKPKQWVSQAAQNSAADEVQRLAREARQLAGRGKDRVFVAQALSQGVPAEKGPDGSVILPAVKPASAQLYLSVALDHTFDEHLSRQSQRALHKRGIKVEPLGVMTYAKWRKRRGSVPANPLAPGPNGQLRPN